MYQLINAILITEGFKLWIPGANVTGGCLVYFRRRPLWKFWKKETMFLRNGEWAYVQGTKYKFGRYEDIVKGGIKPWESTQK